MGMSDPKTSATVVIAIDGPAASGKSTVARALAGHLGYRFLNSGDLYRAMTWACLRRKIDCHDIGAVASAAGQTQIEVGCDGNEYFPLIDSEDPRAHLRKEQVNANVSPVSAVPAVRYIVSAAIRAHATGRQTVIEGRDIGSASRDRFAQFGSVGNHHHFKLHAELFGESSGEFVFGAFRPLAPEIVGGRRVEHRYAQLAPAANVL